jgi:hypothetical protein
MAEFITPKVRLSFNDPLLGGPPFEPDRPKVGGKFTACFTVSAEQLDEFKRQQEDFWHSIREAVWWRLCGVLPPHLRLEGPR